jgi:capsular exopolysaccharide synthesis family protein
MNPGPLDLRDYLAIAWSRKWIIIAVVTTTTVVALFYSSRQTAVYTSSALVVVQPTAAERSPGFLNMNTQEQVANSLPVARFAWDELTDLEVRPGKTVASQVQSTETILFTSESTDPAAAKATANAYANAYLEFRRSEVRKDLEDARRPYEERLLALNIDIEQIEGQIPTTDDEAQRAVLSAQYASLLSERTLLTQRLADLANPLDAEVGELLQEARLPISPSAPDHAKNGAVGLGLGIVLGIGFAFLQDRLDGRIRGREELELHAGAPVLAFIPRFRSKTARRSNSVPPIALSDPESEAAEAYKGLRVRLLRGASEQGFKSIVITSSLPGEGKTSTTANLGVVLAQAGERVVIVSTDLRRPSLQRYFPGDEKGGLTHLLSRRGSLRNELVSTDVQHLSVLHAGPPIESAGPLELLGSQEMTDLLGELAGLADFVLLDTPPLLATSDVAALAPLTDGVLFIADPRVAQGPIVEQARHELELASVPVIGVVVNRYDPRKFRTYGYGYGYSTNGSPRGSGQAAPRGLVQIRRVVPHGAEVPSPRKEVSLEAEVDRVEADSAETDSVEAEASPEAEVSQEAEALSQEAEASPETSAEAELGDSPEADGASRLASPAGEARWKMDVSRRRRQSPHTATAVIREIGAHPGNDVLIAAVLPWILEAGFPYFQWFFEPDDPGVRVEAWIRRASSEVALFRMTMAERDGVPLGGFIALDGKELRACRVADTLAALAEAGPTGSGVQQAKIAAARTLFPAVADDQLYLSKLGVRREYRGQGLGRLLIDRFIERGRENGFETLRLDVAAGNRTAIELYERVGFEVVSESTAPQTDLRYLAMTLRC